MWLTLSVCNQSGLLDPGPSPRPYSPECVEGKFSESNFACTEF